MADDLRADLDQFSRRLVSDHDSAGLGSASVRMKLPRLYARTWSWRRTALAANVRHDSRVHLIAPLPSLMNCSRGAALVVEGDERSAGRALVLDEVKVGMASRRLLPHKHRSDVQ
jgi:hypothetical protein